ncbi:MAG: class I SAM-dependent methyltransferase, partial [Candidatus Hadarchaeum sp.]
MRKRYLADEYGEGQSFWDNTWQKSWTQFNPEPPLDNVLVKIILNYIKPGMRILEGGCGDGRYVKYFANTGFEVIGIDFSIETVKRLNELFPLLDIRVGDVRHLDFPDFFFDAYYSGGVIEHFEDGVETQLSEANRVL